MADDTWLWAAGSLVLWLISATLACVVGLVFAAGTRHRLTRPLAAAGIHVTRGVPTSLLVVAIGMVCLRLPGVSWLPTIFPGTSNAFQFCAWGVAIALALGSSGHIAVIYLTAWESVGTRRLEQARVLGLTNRHQVVVVGREVAPLVLGALGPRLVHHLHNTAFAALFPVTELFGGVVEMANETFRVAEAAAIGAVVYIVISQGIWLATRALESRLRAPGSRETARPVEIGVPA